MAKLRRATMAALAALSRKSGNLRQQQSHQRNGRNNSHAHFRGTFLEITDDQLQDLEKQLKSRLPFH